MNFAFVIIVNSRITYTSVYIDIVYYLLLKPVPKVTVTTYKIIHRINFSSGLVPTISALYRYIILLNKH